MNKTNRLIWSDARPAWIVAHESADSKGKSSSRAKPLAAALAGALLTQVSFAQVPAPNTLPAGGQVVAGQATISQSGSAMTIQQATNKAIVNWNSFSIGSKASVNFQQPSSSSVALNRVLGTAPSAIYGSLTANGQVFLVNPNGVLFGQGARVDVGGLVASTLNIGNEDFLAGNYRFSRDGVTGSVVNQGELYGKYIAMLAPEVRNEGVIVARQGTVALAAGEAVTLGITGKQLIDVQVDKASINTLVENKHLIQADAGTVILSAESASKLLGKVVNTGAIEAKGIDTSGGTVRLLASSEIDHSGEINVDAGKVGAGGTAILFADLANPASKTTVGGTITARGGSESGNGGFIETSGSHLKINDSARIDTRAANGKTGQWLLDPFDFVVAAGGDMTGAQLETLLSANNIAISVTSASANCLDGPFLCAGTVPGTTGTNGDIIINDAVTWSTPTALTLIAYRNIEVNNTITASDAASAIYMLFGQEISGVYKTSAAGAITNGSGGAPTVYAPDGTLLTGVQLQASYTSNPTAFVKLDAGQSSTYGSAPVLNYTAYDKIDLTAPGTLATGTGGTWASAPFTALDSTTDAGTTDYLYAGGLPNTSFFFIPAGFESWTVNKATVTLSAATKTYDRTTTLGAGAFTVTGVAGQTLNYSGATADNANVGGPDGNIGTADNFVSALTLVNGTGLASNYQLPTLNVANAPLSITARPITLTADNQSKVFGTVLNLGNTLFSLTAGTMAGSETITSATLGSANGYDASTTQAAATYAGEITIAGGAGGGGFNASNYAITYFAGDLTITPAGGGGGSGTPPQNQQVKKTVEIIDLTKPKVCATGFVGANCDIQASQPRKPLSCGSGYSLVGSICIANALVPNTEPSLASCMATPSLPGCSAVLPNLTSCIAAPSTPGCSVILPSLASCMVTPTLPGCSAVLPNLTSCIAAPSTPGCSVILPSLASCMATPTLPGCSAVLPQTSTTDATEDPGSIEIPADQSRATVRPGGDVEVSTNVKDVGDDEVPIAPGTQLEAQVKVAEGDTQPLFTVQATVQEDGSVSFDVTFPEDTEPGVYLVVIVLPGAKDQAGNTIRRPRVAIATVVVRGRAGR